MKKFTLILFLLSSVLNLQAQDYIIGFSGSGASTSVETIKVENLTQGKSISLSGAETLHLLDKVTGINPIFNDTEYSLRIYPNPSDGYCTIEFGVRKSGTAIIKVYDPIGREIAKFPQFVSEGIHSFKISGLSNGIYTINVNLEDRFYSEKIISNSKSSSRLTINYNGYKEPVHEISNLKNATTERFWQYNAGDRLKFIGTSTKYSTVVMDIPTKSKTIAFTFIECTDADGNNYPIVQIGNQIWMAENLKTTKFNDGTAIPNITSNIAWKGLTTGAYCWYNNDVNNKNIYGALYNWYAVNTNKLAPGGWHVPTDAELTTLTNYLGGNNIAGGKLKETGMAHWLSPNTGATNEAGFTAFPGGHRDQSQGNYNGKDSFGALWSSTMNDATSAWARSLGNAEVKVARDYFNQNYFNTLGLSVRFIQNTIIPLSISTTEITNLNSTSATSGGNITSDGGTTITARGVCWNTSQNPTTANSKTTDGTGTGSFTSNVTGLTANTKYYVRAYATNSSGTTYGSDVTFTTSPIDEPDNALNFDGINDYVVTSDNDAGLTSFTIEAWVKWDPTASTDINFICGKSIEQMELHTGGGAGVNGIRFIPTNGVYLDATNVLQIGIWTHVAVVYNPSLSLAKMYINGTEVSLVNHGSRPLNTATGNTATPFYLGSRGDAGYRFKGSMDEVRIWNIVRSQAEIQDNMNNAMNTSASGLRNYYNFNQGTAGANNTGISVLHDLTSNGGNGTLTNFALTGITSNWVGRNSILLPATVSSASTTNIAQTTATSGGNVTADGGATVTARGVCWSTGQNPTTANSKTTDGSGTGNFLSSLTGLTAGTTYYVRAYATNSVGTAYGSQMSFTTTQYLSLATVTTNAAANITQTSATSGGNVTATGGATVTARGVCWSISQNPTTANSKTTNSTGTGSFSSDLTGLNANTQYYLRAYATNSVGTAYGNEISFTTGQNINSPTVLTTSATNIAQTTTTSGGNVTSDGGASVTTRGVCWSTSQNPTIANNKTTDGSGIGSFSSSLIGLTVNTLYHIRAYATNSVGTSYGSVLTFTTLATPVLPSVATAETSNISQTTATSGGNVTSDGGATVTSRGVCWSTTQNPTISNSKTTNGTGTGSFTSAITGLTVGTTYYIRAYASNTAGTAYGNEISFITTSNSDCGTVTDIDGNVYKTVTIGTQCWMIENLKTTKYNDGSLIPNEINNTAWVNLTTGAYCWFNNDAATYKNTYGALYNWAAVNSGRLCPSGWHVPTDAEWTILSNFLGGDAISGGKLKEEGTAHWTTPNTGATNEVGFLALPGGDRGSDGAFHYIRTYGFWWSSTNYLYFELGNSINNVVRTSASNKFGFSVRCIKGEGPSAIPSVSTTAATNIAQTAATSGGNITSDGGASVTVRGVCWSTSLNPTTSDSKTSDGIGTGSFTSSPTGLKANTLYHVRAYATNSVGTSYGRDLTFTTIANPVVPTLTTTVATNIALTTATSGGNITSDGGASVTVRGVCWSTSLNPTTVNSKTTDGTGTGSFISNLTGMIAGTVYYVRAYATNITGTAYGDQISFTTASITLPVVTTTAVTNITQTTATSGGKVTADGGATVTARGVCWSTSQNPTTTNSKTNDGNGIETFTSSITGLTTATTYYVRAYAINSNGTAYGDNITFTTSPLIDGPNNALNFDGINDYVVATDNDEGLTAFTIEAWVNWQPNAPTDIQFICGKGLEQMEIHTGSGANDLRFIPTIGVYLDADNVLPIGQWTHVAVVYNPLASLAKMYINGAEVPLVNHGTRPKSTAIANTTTPFYLGSRSDAGSRFKGSIDEVRVWNMVRYQTEIQANMNNEIGVSTTGLRNYYNFNEGTAGENNASITILHDLTLNGGNGTLTNFGLTGTTSNWVERNSITLPTTVSTTQVSNIAQNTATSGGNITNDSGSTLTARGVCWSTSQKPTIANSKTTDGTGTGSFTSNLSGLTENTIYYVRAYASSSAETIYGNEVTFTTSKPASLPTVTTNSIVNFSNSIVGAFGGNVSSEGASAVTSRGIFYSQYPNPYNQNPNIVTKTQNGSGIGNFTSDLTNLTPNKTYYICAYATNSAGTAYGNQIRFVTDINGNLYHTIEIGTQCWMVENLRTTSYNQGSPIYNGKLEPWSSITVPAYCWYNYNYSDSPYTGNEFWGALYNWYAADHSAICPTGWHVPTDGEWTTLTTFLGGESVAGGKLKEPGTTHWTTESGATNESGFTALPGGFRMSYTRDINISKGYNLGFEGNYWSSSTYNDIAAWHISLYADRNSVSSYIDPKSRAYSIRCLKD